MQVVLQIHKGIKWQKSHLLFLPEDRIDHYTSPALFARFCIFLDAIIGNNSKRWAGDGWIKEPDYIQISRIISCNNINIQTNLIIAIIVGSEYFLKRKEPNNVTVKALYFNNLP